MELVSKYFTVNIGFVGDDMHGTHDGRRGKKHECQISNKRRNDGYSPKLSGFRGEM